MFFRSFLVIGVKAIYNVLSRFFMSIKSGEKNGKGESWLMWPVRGVASGVNTDWRGSEQEASSDITFQKSPSGFRQRRRGSKIKGERYSLGVLLVRVDIHTNTEQVRLLFLFPLRWALSERSWVSFPPTKLTPSRLAPLRLLRCLCRNKDGLLRGSATLSAVRFSHTVLLLLSGFFSLPGREVVLTKVF